MKMIDQMCDAVRETAYAIHLYHGHGHHDAGGEPRHFHTLSPDGLEVKQQYPIQVFNEDETVIGDFMADILVEGRLIIGLKAVQSHGGGACCATVRIYEVQSDEAWAFDQFRFLQI